jgi:tryptophan synthase alpha chain
MMNRITELFKSRKDVLSIYFSAGFPGLNDTIPVLEALTGSGADMIEIGIPFSDPLADGPVIQHSSEIALSNGMTLSLLFEQLKDIRKSVAAPLLLMGYLNPVLQFGMENFCKKAKESGIDGVIIPDLPLSEYFENYQALFEKYGLLNIFLITPQSSEARIRLIDEHSNGFIYMVSSASTTGTKDKLSPDQLSYFERIRNMKLRNPLLIGFGISDRSSFERACGFANGAIIGSAYVKALEQGADVKASTTQFIQSIRSN